jgi:hypothetical protein
MDSTVRLAQRSRSQTRPFLRKEPNSRRGAIIALSAVLMVVCFAMLAFTVDIGYTTLAKAQLRAAADGGSLAAGLELIDGLGPAPLRTSSQVQQLARAAALDIAARHKAGDKSSVSLIASRDVQLGRYQKNSSSGQWEYSWGTTPYNMVRVAAIRGDKDPSDSPNDAGFPTTGDVPLPLFFAGVIGHDNTNVAVRATVALLPAVGFRPTAGDNAPILPIAVDQNSWTALLNGTGSDSYKYNSSTGTVSAGSDGVKELNIYPLTTTAGNRGTINLGVSNNSTSVLNQQILNGLTASQLAAYGGQMSFESGPINVGGNPGISAAIQSSLQQIIGKTRAIPLFTTVTGNGNNAVYTLVKFVGVRILYVNLNGGNKSLIIQPATLVDSTAVSGNIAVSDASIFTPLKIIQ